MGKKLEYVSLIIVLTLAFVLITDSQFKVSSLYSYDAYFHTGIAHIILDTQNVVYDEMQPPHAASSAVVNMGYVPMPPILQVIISFLTSSNLFISAKIYTIVIFLMLVLSIFILAKRLTNSFEASVFSSFVFAVIPIVFYRTNYITGESTAVLFWLLILGILINSKKDVIFPIIPLLIAALAFHPRSMILYLLLLLILYLLTNKSERNIINKKNVIIVSFICALGLPFWKFLILNLLAWTQRGATYVLFPPLSVSPISFELISNQLGSFILLISFLGIIYLFSNLKAVECQFMSMWLFLGWAAIPIGYHLSFPSNRLTLHLGVIIALLCGCILCLFKNKHLFTIFKRLSIPFILFLLIVPAVSNFHSSTYKPFLGWGDEEKEAMMFLSNNLTATEENNGNYLIFTPEFGMPFGYGIKNIEFNESLIAQILGKSSSENKLLDELKNIYPERDNVYIIIGASTEATQFYRFPVLKKLCKNNILYENSRVQIYRYQLKRG